LIETLKKLTWYKGTKNKKAIRHWKCDTALNCEDAIC